MTREESDELILSYSKEHNFEIVHFAFSEDGYYVYHLDSVRFHGRKVGLPIMIKVGEDGIVHPGDSMEAITLYNRMVAEMKNSSDNH